MQKKFSLTVQELSHAQWAVGAGNFDTELGKAIQRKLLGYLVGKPDVDVAMRLIVADELMDTRSVNFTLGIDEGDNTVCADQIVGSADMGVLTCEFVIQANELEELEDRYADQPASEETVADWVNERMKKKSLSKRMVTRFGDCASLMA